MTAIIPTTSSGAQRMTRNALTELRRGRVPRYRVLTAPADFPTPTYDAMIAEIGRNRFAQVRTGWLVTR